MRSDFSLNIVNPGRRDGSVDNLETFWRWDVSSNPGAVTRTGIFPHKKYINKKYTQQVENDYFVKHTKFDFTVDEGKGWLNPSREKIKASTAEGRWMRNPV